uniref:ADF-H domain-containing protein n=1 Tax=Caenorhabditis tropicalis TaxID=1561998 RepID=A0A1I7TC23_9PELO
MMKAIEEGGEPSEKGFMIICGGSKILKRIRSFKMNTPKQMSGTKKMFHDPTDGKRTKAFMLEMKLNSFKSRSFQLIGFDDDPPEAVFE